MNIAACFVVWIFVLNVRWSRQEVPHIGKYGYHDYRGLTKVLKSMAAEFPHMAHLYSIGKSVEGKELWVLALASHSPDKHVPRRDEVVYIANMHGDEPVGKEMLLYLADHLLRTAEEANAIDYDKVRVILNTTRVHIMPSMNPDGFEIANEGKCRNSLYTGRNNARNIDLNRDFPDQFISPDRSKEREPETIAVMKWLDEVPFSLAANFHGGALVANYPFDSNSKSQQKYSTTPDDDVLRNIALSYAKNHEHMALATQCKDGDDPYFRNGITNGADWYPVTGSLQDYQYVFKGTMAITVELSCCKYPTSENLDHYWSVNRLPLMEFILQANQGIRGFVFDANNQPLVANMHIESRNITFFSSIDGEFHRILLPGSYVLSVGHEKYERETVEFTISEGNPLLEANVTLRTARRFKRTTKNMSLTYEPLEIRNSPPTDKKEPQRISRIKWKDEMNDNSYSVKGSLWKLLVMLCLYCCIIFY